MKEKQLVKNLKDWLNKQPNTVAYKMHGSQFMENGIPDLLICHNGEFIAIETKVKNNKPSPVQIYQLKRLQKSGAKVYIINENNVKYFKENMETLTNERANSFSLPDWSD